jgi:DNA-binding SARP family transcriptional activator
VLEIRLLGGLRLKAAGRTLPPPDTRPGRALLGWLSLHPGPHGRSRLAGTLRPDASEQAARQSLRQALWSIRRALGDSADEALVAGREEAGLSSDVVSVDVLALRERAERGDLEAATAIASETLLPELDDDWVIEARERIAAEVAEICARQAAAAEAAGDVAGALQWSRERARLEPLSESAHCGLIRMHAVTGDRASALRVADELRRRLSEELGVAPSAETRALVEGILVGDGPSASATVAPASGRPPTAGTIGVPLPAALAAAQTTPFVGRQPELAVIEEAWSEAVGGRAELVLLGGEPGIGKTRCGAEIARRVHADGALVLYGRCDEEPLGPYQPFVEAIDQWLEDAGVGLEAIVDPPHRSALARILPQHSADESAAAVLVRADPELARFHLFEAIRAALTKSVGRPILLVLDDLHWADAPTTALLLHLARRLTAARLLIIGTYRDTKPAVAGPGGRLAGALAELRKRGDVSIIALPALGEDAVAQLIAATGGEALDPAVAPAVHRQTGGNALFVVETLRQLIERKAVALEPGEIPLVLRDVIDQRVAQLGDTATAVLRAAAVAGQQFDLRTVEQASELPASSVLDAIEAALASRLVRELPGTPGRYAFSHALVADALYHGMSGARRARLHAAVGAALACSGGPPAAVANHLLAAVPLDAPDEAAEWTERAAQQATEALAYEEAASLNARAAERLEGLSPGRRARLLLGAADPLDRLGRRADAQAACLAAADLARAAGDADLLARAALGYRGLGVTIAQPDPRAVSLVEESLARGDAAESSLRARLLAGLALETYYADRRRSAELSREATALARASGDPVALAETLSARHAALWNADGTFERLDVANEMFEVARAAGEPIAAMQARNWRFVDLFELGRIDEAEREAAAYAAEAERLRIPRLSWYVSLWRSALAILRGDFDRAAEWTAEAYELGVEAQDANAPRFRQIQDYLRLVEQRRFADLDHDSLVQASKESPAGRRVWLATLTSVEAHTGREEQARRTFAELLAEPFALVPVDANWHIVCEAAEACALIGDERLARHLLETLADHAALYPVVGRGIGTQGPVAYFLGRLHGVLGEHPQAVDRFRQALDLCERTGARPRAALSRLRLGETLRRQGDAIAARREIDRARREMEPMGMVV